MIAEYLERDFVLAQLQAEQAFLRQTLKQSKLKGPKGVKVRALMQAHELDEKKVKILIALTIASLADAARDQDHPKKGAYIPSSPFICALQTGLTKAALNPSTVIPATSRAHVSAKVTRRQPGTGQLAKKATKKEGKRKGEKATVILDTSAELTLKNRSEERRKAARTLRAPFVEGDDINYALAGAKAKVIALFQKPHEFNDRPAVIARTDKPLSLFVFGDWGTGLPLARAVTQRISEQIDKADGTRQLHVIHLGDVYYIGEPQEYADYVFDDRCWPVNTQAKIDTIGSWSLNGNHDRYSGCYGYFDTLLSEKRFFRWHQDDRGLPSSFFLIENDDWQVFGLDTAWDLPTLKDTMFDDPTIYDYTGQNGILTPSQAAWMGRERRAGKGCILLTHHQPVSSRTGDKQNAKEAVKALKKAGVYDTIDAWFWGHEHRAVVFKPKSQRQLDVLQAAPAFCCCLGHGGVPVTRKNFKLGETIADVEWQELIGPDAPVYEGESVLPFGFGRIDTSPGKFVFTLFDYAGNERYSTEVVRQA